MEDEPDRNSEFQYMVCYGFEYLVPRTCRQLEWFIAFAREALKAQRCMWRIICAVSDPQSKNRLHSRVRHSTTNLRFR